MKMSENYLKQVRLFLIKTNLLSWGYIFLYMNALNSLTFQSIVHVLYLYTFIHGEVKLKISKFLALI